MGIARVKKAFARMRRNTADMWSLLIADSPFIRSFVTLLRSFPGSEVRVANVSSVASNFAADGPSEGHSNPFLKRITGSRSCSIAYSTSRMRAELPGSPSLSLASASCPADLISEAVAFEASLKIANGLLGFIVDRK